MKNLKDIYQRLREKKSERSEIQKMIRDELHQNARHLEIVEEMQSLREEKRAIEQEVKESSGDAQRLDDLKIDIASDQELLADVALNMYLENETVEIVDEYDMRWVPEFRVKFVKE